MSTFSDTRCIICFEPLENGYHFCRRCQQELPFANRQLILRFQSMHFEASNFLNYALETARVLLDLKVTTEMLKQVMEDKKT